MTGKEALKEWIDHYRIDCHKYCGYSFLEKLKIIEEYLEELEVENLHLKAQLEFSGLLEYETKKELTKYEKAFEIIKKHSKVDYIENTNINDLGKDYNLFICEINSIEDKEEYELLEELMVNENS